MIDKNEKQLAPIFPNSGIEARYRKAMQAAIAEMAKSYAWWLRAELRGIAMDAEQPIKGSGEHWFARNVKIIMDKLARQWQDKFDALSEEIARIFVNGVTQHTDKAMIAAMDKAGFSFKFQMTDQVKKAAQLSFQGNVGLIKTIPAEFHQAIEGDVWRMVQSGFNTKQLTDAIEQRYHKSHWRASFIARDQTSKVKAIIERERQRELGITEAIWIHSHGGKEPRPSHVKAGRDKLRFDINKGAYLEGNGGKYEWLLPGQALNCRCVSKSIIKEFE
jgi:hypothetical protein